MALVNGPGPRFEVRKASSSSCSLFFRFPGPTSALDGLCLAMGFFDFVRRLFNPPPPTRRAQPLIRPAQPPPPVRVTPIRQAPPEPKRLNLEASQFAPISSRDALAQARTSTTVRSNPWWGRLDTIPPASDERTLLIDRSLVAYGLLTSDDLVEIHNIGDQMLDITGDQAVAAERARAAVVASEAERKRLKEQKKAGSAERKRKHAAEVAEAKPMTSRSWAGGLRGLVDRRAHIEKLQAARLPVLASPADIAHALGISISRLRWLAFHSDAAEKVHYVRFTVPKRSGGVRELSAPHRELAAAQRWIFQNILQGLPTHPAAHGFVRGRSIRSNALPHVGRHILVNADLRDFFPTITFHRVRGAFERLGYSPSAATILGLLCTESPRRTVEYAGTTFHVATGPRAMPQGDMHEPRVVELDLRAAGFTSERHRRQTGLALHPLRRRPVVLGECRIGTGKNDGIPARSNSPYRPGRGICPQRKQDTRAQAKFGHGGYGGDRQPSAWRAAQGSSSSASDPAQCAEARACFSRSHR